MEVQAMKGKKNLQVLAVLVETILHSYKLQCLFLEVPKMSKKISSQRRKYI